MNHVERTRMDYRPAEIRMLFVGESPTAKGGFFYFGGGGFTGHTRRAFELALKRRFTSDVDFLQAFQGLGCWLDDVSRVPVNHLQRKDREAVLQRSTGALAARLRKASPAAVVVMLKRIARYVDQAIEMANIRPAVHRLPFPGFRHQKRFVEELVPILREAWASGLLRRQQRAPY